MTTPELVIIITTAATAVVSIVNSISAGWGRQEMRKQVAENKQITKDAHQDIVSKVTETNSTVNRVAHGDINTLINKIDSLSDRVGHIESWMTEERSIRTKAFNFGA
jgi:hypothetical protein